QNELTKTTPSRTSAMTSNRRVSGAPSSALSNEKSGRGRRVDAETKSSSTRIDVLEQSRDYAGSAGSSSRAGSKASSTGREGNSRVYS
ncbi:unnamed protein product, partial [Amoebophrya sp. A25]